MQIGNASRPRPFRGPYLEIGALALPRRDIVGCRLDDVIAQDRPGRIATLALIFAAGLVLAVGVLSLEWRTQAMLTATVVAVLALVCGMETLGLAPSTLYRFVVQLRDGRRIDVATSDREHADELAAHVGEPSVAVES